MKVNSVNLIEDKISPNTFIQKIKARENEKKNKEPPSCNKSYFFQTNISEQMTC